MLKAHDHEASALAEVVRRHFPDSGRTAEIAQALIAHLDAFERPFPSDHARVEAATQVEKAAAKFAQALAAADLIWAEIQAHDGVALGERWVRTAEGIVPNDNLEARERYQRLAERIGAGAAATRKANTMKGRPRNYARYRLARVLGRIWREMTGEEPRYSGEQTFDAPKTKFGKFAADVLRQRTSTEPIREGFNFADFVADATGPNKWSLWP